MPNWPKHLPLPDKRVCDLSDRQTQTFRNWMGLNETGTPTDSVPYPTPQEKKHRQKRERWKRRFAGKGQEKPSLLIRSEQIARLKKNVKVEIFFTEEGWENFVEALK